MLLATNSDAEQLFDVLANSCLSDLSRNARAYATGRNLITRETCLRWRWSTPGSDVRRVIVHHGRPRGHDVSVCWATRQSLTRLLMRCKASRLATHTAMFNIYKLFYKCNCSFIQFIFQWISLSYNVNKDGASNKLLPLSRSFSSNWLNLKT